ncbi:peptidase [Amaricoccus sp. W119]|uniref:peptidase n=1 Tax=Amaricoccus sp. W119 TaxID=3391833 RepID=UPI0039A71555
MTLRSVNGDDAIPADPARVIAAARAWLGTPYHDQTSVPGVGCDCLGLARGVWRAVVGSEPADVPPYGRGWSEIGAREVLAEGARARMIEISLTDLQPGAVVLFRLRDGGVARHVGNLTGETSFIHACERLGVIEQKLTLAWRRRLAFVFLFPERTT